MKNNTLSEKEEKKAISFSNLLGNKYSEKNVSKIEKVKEFFLSKKSFQKIKEQIEILWNVLKSSETPKKVKIAIYGAFAYMVLPIDVISDLIPGIGFLDDAAVFVYVWKTVTPYLKSIAGNVAKENIEIVLNDSLREMIINAIIIFLLNCAGTIVACFNPCGDQWSILLASVFFIGALIYSLVGLVFNLKKNGKMIFSISQKIIKHRSVRKGIADFVRTDDQKVFRMISKVFQFTGIASKMGDLDLPNLEEVIHHFVKMFFKRVLICVGLYALYVVGVYWILKPYLLHHFTNMGFWQIVIFPFWYIFNIWR